MLNYRSMNSQYKLNDRSISPKSIQDKILKLKKQTSISQQAQIQNSRNMKDKNVEQNSNYRNLEIKCKYHQDKKAKYTLNNQNQILYLCSKCAIELAQQGHQITELNVPDQKKQQIMNLFLNNILETEQNVKQDKQKLQKKNQNCNEFYQNQIQNIDIIYNEMISSLNKEKESLLKQVQHDYAKNKGIIAKHDYKLTEFRSEMTKMKNDIQQHSKPIISDVDMASFQSIIGQYELVLKNIQNSMASFYDQQLVMEKVKQMDLQKKQQILKREKIQIREIQTDLMDSNNQTRVSNTLPYQETRESVQNEQEQETMNYDLKKYNQILRNIEVFQTGIQQKYNSNQSHNYSFEQEIDQCNYFTQRTQTQRETFQLNDIQSLLDNENISDNSYQMPNCERNLFGSPNFK